MTGVLNRGVLVAVLVVAGAGCPAPITRSGPGPQLESEREIGREFAREAAHTFQFVDDDDAVELVNEVALGIVAPRGRSPFDYHLFVVRDPSLNAFAVPGGYIYAFSGLLGAVESVGELAGVLAHEIAHVEGHHFMRRYQDTVATTIGAAAASVLALIFLPPKEGAAAAVAAQAATMTQQLSYTRRMEEEADVLGMKMASDAGWDSGAIGAFLERIRSPTALPGYLFTHPSPEERVARVRALEPNFPRGRPAAPDLVKRFRKAQAIARARTHPIEGVLESYRRATRERPDDAEAAFLLGAVEAALGAWPRAVAALERAVALDPTSVAARADLGVALAAQGETKRAEGVLAEARQLAPDDPHVLYGLGEVYLESERLAEAVRVLHEAVQRAPQRWRPYHSLGTAYGRRGQEMEGHTYLGRAFHLRWEFERARIHYVQALSLADGASEQAAELRRLLAAVAER
jgi:predicted Zn-dependent protease